MKAGKRKAGPGRKPAGTIRSKVSNFSTRITAETRVALETEARATEQSVSQVAEQLLRLGIKTKRERERPDALRAFCYLVAELAELICNFTDADGKPVFDWRTTPFTFEAFRLAIQKLMDAIKPSGEVRSPTEDEPTLANSLLSGPYDSPQARAEWATMILWHNLQCAESGRLRPEFLWHNLQCAEPGRLRQKMLSPPITVDELTEIESMVYSMARARQDLQIEFRRSRP